MGIEVLEGSLHKFTDRIVQRDEFKEIYINEYMQYFKESDNVKKIKAINYYGVGGAGKSSLLQKIFDELNTYGTFDDKGTRRPVYAYYDFESGAFEAYDVLSAIVKNIKDRYGNAFKFKRFEAAYQIFIKKQMSFHISDDGGFLDKNEGIKIANGALSFIPGLSTVGNVISLVDTISSVGKTLSKFKKELQKADIKTLIYNMPDYFVEDMKENMEEADIPFVIFLDTYEKYINAADHSEEVTIRDKWLYQERDFLRVEGIIHKLPDVLWVIAGREEMRWGVGDNSWLKTIEVDNFDRQYTMEFLDKYQILDHQIREHIFETTQGNPFYLRICAAIYEDMVARNQEVRLEDFNPDRKGSKEILIERYVRYLENEQQEEMVYRLSCFDGWDKQLLDYAIAKELGVERVLDKLLKFSFITCNQALDGNGRVHERYHMHQTMRKVIHTACKPKIKEEMHQKIREYYATYLKTHDTFSFDYEHGLRVFMNDCMEQLTYSECKEAFDDTVFPAFGKLWNSLRHQAAYSIAEIFLRRVMDQYPDTELHAQCLILFANCTFKMGNVMAIRTYLEEAIAVLERNGLEESRTTLLAYEKLIQYYIAFKDNKTAALYAEKVYDKRRKQLGDKDPDTLLAKMKYAIIIKNQERNVEGTMLCIKYLTEVSQGMAEYYGEDAPETIEAYLELLNAKRFEMGADFSKLFDDTELIYQRCVQEHGEGVRLTIRAKCITAIYAGLIKDFPLAINRQKEIVDFYQKNLGWKHTITVNALKDLAIFYDQSGDNDLYEQVMLSISASGLMEQDRWPAMFFQAETHISSKEIAQAKEIYQKLLNEIRNKLEPDHIEVITYTNKIIHRLCKYSYYEEALELYQDIRQTRYADDTLLKIMRVIDKENLVDVNYEDLCNKLGLLIEEQRTSAGDGLIFWKCRQYLTNLMVKANLEEKAYQIRQELWSYDLTDFIEGHKYEKAYKILQSKLNSLRRGRREPDAIIKAYRDIHQLLKGKIFQDCNRHKMIYTTLNQMCEEYKKTGQRMEVLMMKIRMYNLSNSVFGKENKTSRYIMSEMQQLAKEEKWIDWIDYLQDRKLSKEPVVFVQCKECSSIRPDVIVNCCKCN